MPSWCALLKTGFKGQIDFYPIQSRGTLFKTKIVSRFQFSQLFILLVSIKRIQRVSDNEVKSHLSPCSGSIALKQKSGYRVFSTINFLGDTLFTIPVTCASSASILSELSIFFFCSKNLIYYYLSCLNIFYSFHPWRWLTYLLPQSLQNIFYIILYLPKLSLFYYYYHYYYYRDLLILYQSSVAFYLESSANQLG